MKAILLNEAGGIENFIYQEIDKPTLQKGEVLVKVKAIGINPVDAYARQSEEMITMFTGAAGNNRLGYFRRNHRKS